MIQPAELSEGERKNLARTLFNEGVKLQESGKAADIPTALAKFEAAEKYYPAPTIILHLAECQALTGRLPFLGPDLVAQILFQRTLNPPQAGVQALLRQ